MLQTFLNLQLFADGGDSGAAAAPAAGGGQDAAVTGESAAPVAQTDSTTVAEGNMQADPAERLPFEQIRELYKDDINSQIKKTVEKRLRQEKASNAAAMKKLQPLIDRAARRYNVDGSDIDTLMGAVQADRSYYEELAEKKGTTPEFEEQFDIMTREARDAKAELARREEQDRAREQYNHIAGQVQEARKVFPDFDLETEMQNPTFASLAQNPYVTLREAYQAVHFDELTSRAMQTAAQTVEQKVVNSVKSGRPTENGNGNGAPAAVRSDPSKLSLKEIQSIIERAKRGEIIKSF